MKARTLFFIGWTSYGISKNIQRNGRAHKSCQGAFVFEGQLERRPQYQRRLSCNCSLYLKGVYFSGNLSNSTSWNCRNSYSWISNCQRYRRNDKCSNLINLIICKSIAVWISCCIICVCIKCNSSTCGHRKLLSLNSVINRIQWNSGCRTRVRIHKCHQNVLILKAWRSTTRCFDFDCERTQSYKRWITWHYIQRWCWARCR